MQTESSTRPKRTPPPVHNFASCREYAGRHEAEWQLFYHSYFSGFGVVSVHTIPNGANYYQRAGIDREIYLANGKIVRVDEKVRAADYGDCLLEEWSVFRGVAHKQNKIGWALDESKRCDYVAYAIAAPEFTVHMLPWLPLLLAVKSNISRWRGGEGGASYPKDARNKRYRSRNVAVPWPELRRSISDAMLYEPAPF